MLKALAWDFSLNLMWPNLYQCQLSKSSAAMDTGESHARKGAVRGKVLVLQKAIWACPGHSHVLFETESLRVEQHLPSHGLGDMHPPLQYSCFLEPQRMGQ